MNWYVVATKPNCEYKALTNLQRQDFESYLPCILVRRSHARRLNIVQRPLFSGYVFVQLDPEVARWRSINGTIGVTHILTSNGRPQPLRNGFIDALRSVRLMALLLYRRHIMRLVKRWRCRMAPLPTKLARSCRQTGLGA